MPKNKHKRKASAHSKIKLAKSPSLVTSHPKVFGLIGLFLIMVSMYLLFFESQDDAMFGLAMLSLIVGVTLTIFSKMRITKKNQSRV
ncbi:hypothetical protein [Candidatus Colwellia aromaticivorans]|uniref:hypothetical protein n=1 Tax=Candidatus Colwellia aromaticivorans TaxID=2267621 RepID=UPI000DF3453B|nr:hypothetical protein [Candidatus Colwellia aromaticivorans]